MTPYKWDRGARLLGMKKPFGDSNRSEEHKVLLACLEDVVRQKMEEAAAAHVNDDGGTGS